MSLQASFFSALSGLDTQSTAMQVIGDNIANLHTNGLKEPVHFEDRPRPVLNSASGTNATGVGAKVASIDGNFTQGTLDDHERGYRHFNKRERVLYPEGCDHR